MDSLRRALPVTRLNTTGRHLGGKVVDGPDGQWVVMEHQPHDPYRLSARAHLSRTGTAQLWEGGYATPYVPARPNLRPKPLATLVRTTSTAIHGTETPLPVWWGRVAPSLQVLPQPWTSLLHGRMQRLQHAPQLVIHGDLREHHIRQEFVHHLGLCGPIELDLAALLPLFPGRPIIALLDDLGINTPIGYDAALIQVGLAWARRIGVSNMHYPTIVYAGWMLELGGFARIQHPQPLR
jgi:hypothetical protein